MTFNRGPQRTHLILQWLTAPSASSLRATAGEAFLSLCEAFLSLGFVANAALAVSALADLELARD
jgi:hypothetical protein